MDYGHKVPRVGKDLVAQLCNPGLDRRSPAFEHRAVQLVLH
jgi:hypothetical protein